MGVEYLTKISNGDLPVVISCASVALADAGIMMYDLVTSVSVVPSMLFQGSLLLGLISRATLGYAMSGLLDWRVIDGT
ncbi:probable zinc metalloprotease EGY1, chloroplastic [Humulus lupulus]|uniref:probable zinc metalloprotease EGY1, chloroplastic n=1 Tax=Humulus lupulus TaxID=3486 RepID=UPI002B414BCD|nr:probable zinc metalloprotease EGY1, chloroplastic [Humulus lupulus]